jgi:GNAT superfamily N-acetyltransferase
LLRGFAIRQVRRRDQQSLLNLVDALAHFEKLKPPDPAGRKRLLRDLFVKKRINALLAFEGKRAVGYALYFFTYSSFLAMPTLYLEDIFILEEYRGRGLGKYLFIECVRRAKEEDCGTMEWAVLKWNSNAIRFYENTMGARKQDEWDYYRLDREQFTHLLRGKR